MQSRDEDALWNFTRRSPIKGRTGELETEFRSQPGNLTTGMEIESYTPTTTPPTRSAGSDRTPSKSMYQVISIVNIDVFIVIDIVLNLTDVM